MRAAAKAHGLSVVVDSAGTGDWHVGHPPDRRAQAVAAANGVDASDLRARQVTAADFHDFDLILAADSQNLRDVEALQPAGATATLALMLDMVLGREGDAVLDPYYGGESDFAATWEDVTAVAAAVVGRIKSGVN